MIVLDRGRKELDTIYIVEVFGDDRVTYDGPRKLLGEEIFEEYPSREQILFAIFEHEGKYGNVKQFYKLIY